MTTSSAALSSTPRGLVSETAPLLPPVGVLLPPVAQASRRPTAGTASRLRAPARCSTVRRLRLGLAAPATPLVSSERDILCSSYFGSGSAPDASGVPRLEG